MKKSIIFFFCCFFISSFSFSQDLDDELIEMQATINPSTGLGFEVESKLQTLAGFWDEQKLLIGDFNGDGNCLLYTSPSPRD